MAGVTHGPVPDMTRYPKKIKMLRRPRRNRKSESVRKLVRENLLTANDLVMPLFLVDGENKKEDIPSLPMAQRYSIDTMLEEIEDCISWGLHAFIVFPKIDDALKDKTASHALDKSSFYLEAARKIKSRFPQITLISDVALDPYNSDGHDGIVQDGVIVNDATLKVLEQMAVLQAEAGFDIIGPSDMMDGRIEAIRQALDLADFHDVSIMSYTAKYASAFYGPFRDALNSAPVEDSSIPSHKKSYQMDPANSREALIEAELDTIEGADFLMVKPAIHYLDIIAHINDEFELPVVAYHVSGECAMLWAACQNGWLDYKTAIPETLLSIKRAGAKLIISYYAKEYLKMQAK